MNKSLTLVFLLGILAPLSAQTGLNRFRLFDKVTKWFEGYRYTDTTHGAEVIQGFPADFFPGFRRIDGISFTFFQTNKAFVRVMDFYVHPDKGGKPDLASPPLYAFRAKTLKGSGRGPAYPFSYLFPKPFLLPKGAKTLWIGVHLRRDQDATDQAWFGALAAHGMGGRPGVLARKGVPNPRLAYHVLYKGGKPDLSTLAVRDGHWVWTLGFLTRDPVLRGYIKLNTDIPPHQGGSIQGKTQYGMGAMWPDIGNAEGLPSPGRHDLLGWIVDQHHKKAAANTLTAFVFLQNRRLAAPISTSAGEWFLGFGGPFAAVPPLWSPLTNGTWTVPALSIPPGARAFLLGTWLYAQAVVFETDPQYRLIGASLTNMVAMSL